MIQDVQSKELSKGIPKVAASAKQVEYIDVAKGIGIILVVYGHLLSSAYHAGLKIPERFFGLSDSIVYSFHMPLFFFLSGLFVESSFQKRDPKQYLLDKFIRTAYPYLVWSVLQVSVEVIFSNQTQKGAGLADLFAVPFRPWGQFWFMYALFLMNITYTIISRLGKFAAPTLFVISFALFIRPIPVAAFGLFGFSGHFLFFVSGIYLRKYVIDHERYTIPPWTVPLLFMILIGFGYYLFSKVIEPMRLVGKPYPQYFLFLSILGITACLGLAQYIAARKTMRFLRTLGVYSLQIFLAHMLVGVATRIILMRLFNIQNWIVHVSIGVAIATMIPILLQKISIRVNFPYLFGFKRNITVSGLELSAGNQLSE